MNPVSRRRFFKQCATIGAGIAGTKFFSGCGMFQGPAALPEGMPNTPTDASAQVSVVRGLDLYEMTQQALKAVGGMGSIVQPNEKVFIKPNLGTAGFVKHDIFTTGECVKPEIIITVAEECLKAGASQVVIGEGGQVDSFDWSTLKFSLTDATKDLASEAQRLNDQYPGKITLSCLETESPGWDPVASPWTGLGQILISNYATTADRVISLAVLKTHRWSGITGVMKNLFGLTPRSEYGPNGQSQRTLLHQAGGGPDQCFLDIVAGIKPDLYLLDASIGVEGNGPHVLPGWWGTTVDVKDRVGSWFMLAGTEPVAVDATAARTIGLDPTTIQQFNLAYQQGLGQLAADKITLNGAAMADLQMNWVPAEHTEGFGEVIIPGLMMLLE